MERPRQTRPLESVGLTLGGMVTGLEKAMGAFVYNGRSSKERPFFSPPPLWYHPPYPRLRLVSPLTTNPPHEAPHYPPPHRLPPIGRSLQRHQPHPRRNRRTAPLPLCALHRRKRPSPHPRARAMPFPKPPPPTHLRRRGTGHQLGRDRAGRVRPSARQPLLGVSLLGGGHRQ